MGEYIRGLEVAKELHTRTNPGGCKIPSLGDGCKCFLCQVDDLLNEVQQEEDSIRMGEYLRGLEVAKELHLRTNPGGCKTLSVGEGCKCFLCQVNRLIAKAQQANAALGVDELKKVLIAWEDIIGHDAGKLSKGMQELILQTVRLLAELRKRRAD